MNGEIWRKSCGDFLPDGWRFEISRRDLYVDWEKECIFVPKNFDFTSESILGLMHEIGHAWSDDNRSDEVKEYECWLRDKACMGFEQLTDAEKGEYQRVVIGEELVAWNFVLENLEDLKKKGLVDGEVDVNDVRILIERKMGTYRNMLDD